MVCTTYVSIPYGKGKVESIKGGAVVSITYQFPMGKVKMQETMMKQRRRKVSIPYGKGKA